MLKGKDKLETVENYFILILIVGAALLVSGIGFAAIFPQGVSAIVTMVGSFISFIFTILLILVWFLKSG